MKRTLISTSIYLTALLSLSMVTASAISAEKTTVLVDKPSEVMMFGSFHFNNPGLDTVKSSVIDITTIENQQYLVELSTSIANDFSPTHVLAECSLKMQDKINQDYKSFLAGEFALPVNETYQLGFRIAKLAKAQGIVCFDERDTPWKAGPLMSSMPKDAPEIQKEVEQVLAKFSKDTSKMHTTMSLKDILASSNDQDKDRFNKSLYLLTNSVGAGDSFVGADAAASWWHRNFRMYANVQKIAKENTRVFVIAGAGHTAIMKDFVKFDTKVVGKDASTYF